MVEDWVFTGIQLWNLRTKAHFSCELELEVFLDINLVSQINEGTKVMASLGHMRWRLLCQVFSVDEEEGGGVRSAVSSSGSSHC
ncbi:PREDICTED: putative uncharacterized protein C3orf42-like [Lipotes vexillifer]|uniref:Uncharacterized protein n=1 Tax=Lipotes vexillifer TaxID=118797 RepID=A0A340WX11_LIPVE|nr:PREDICTED: putative uncharacterized protein C3orf42-like [Lipotes vexillifer]